MRHLDWQQSAPGAYRFTQTFGPLRCEARVHQVGSGKWMHHVVVRRVLPLQGTSLQEAGAGGVTVAYFLSAPMTSREKAQEDAEAQWRTLVQRHIPHV